MAKHVRAKEARKTQREIFGDAFVAQRDATTNDFNRDLRELAEGVVFGQIWSRPDLERKTRSLICLALLTALSKPHELHIHVHAALNNGCSPKELRELILQISAYCGFPAASELNRVTEKVLAERGIALSSPQDGEHA